MSDLSFNPIHMAYGFMFVGIIFCFVIARRQGKDMRKTVDRFAFAFAELSNLLIPGQGGVSLKAEAEEDGGVRLAPLEEQSKQVYMLIRKVRGKKAAELFAQMAAASEAIDRQAGINRTKKRQFADPVREILDHAHDFLTGLENLGGIDTVAKKERVESFASRQAEYRMALLKRISREAGERYRELNAAYAEQLKEMERLERERGRGSKTGS